MVHVYTPSSEADRDRPALSCKPMYAGKLPPPPCTTLSELLLWVDTATLLGANHCPALLLREPELQ